MNDQDVSLIERACTRLVLEAAAANDRHDFAAFASLFAVDGVLYRPSGEPLRGRGAIVESYRARPKSRMTRHVCSNVLVHVESANAARALTYVVLYGADAEIPPDGQFGVACEPRRLIGEFADRFVLTAEGWRIKERRARFVMHT
jgi:uncharacterized protein (TIGR02246 family)